MTSCIRCTRPVRLRALTISLPTFVYSRVYNVHCSATESAGLIYAVSSGLEHDWPMHSENAKRVLSITEGLVNCGLLDDHRIRELQYSPASRDSIKLVHTPAYVDGLAKVVESKVQHSYIFICGTKPSQLRLFGVC